MRSKLASTNIGELERENKDRFNKQDFRQAAIGDSTRLHYESCAQTESEQQSQMPGEYQVLDN